jgi:hypothetical protein
MFKVGDWVVRKPTEMKSGRWREKCLETGIDPTAAIQVDEDRGYGPIFYKINREHWIPYNFITANHLTKKLEDYL